MLASADAVFHVDYHLVEISSTPPQPVFASPGEALRAHMAGARVSAPAHTEWLLMTGIAAGPIRLRFLWLAARPAGVEPGWEDVAEASIALPAGTVVLTSPTTESAVGLGELAEALSLRYRVHAKGRTVNYDGVDWEPAEEYLVLAWEEAPGEVTVHAAAGGPAGPLIMPTPPGLYTTGPRDAP